MRNTEKSLFFAGTKPCLLIPMPNGSSQPPQPHPCRCNSTHPHIHTHSHSLVYNHHRELHTVQDVEMSRWGERGSESKCTGSELKRYAPVRYRIAGLRNRLPCPRRRILWSEITTSSSPLQWCIWIRGRHRCTRGEYLFCCVCVQYGVQPDHIFSFLL